MKPPKTCYIIASAPRSGSHLLSTLLGATGLAGKPEEHFNPWHMGLATDFPMDMIFQGRSMRLFHARQQSATMSS